MAENVRDLDSVIDDLLSIIPTPHAETRAKLNGIKLSYATIQPQGVAVLWNMCSYVIDEIENIDTDLYFHVKRIFDGDYSDEYIKETS